MSSQSIPLTSSHAFMARYLALEQPAHKIQVTYVFLHPGNDGQAHFLGKTKVVSEEPGDASDLPLLEFNTSADSKGEILLRPVRLYDDPFRRGDNKLVLCDTLSADMEPLPSNHRASCVEAMEAMEALDDHEYPRFGFEQEYMLRSDCPEPVTSPHIQYHSAVGAGSNVGRDVMEAHFRACLYAEVNIKEGNAKANLGHWEYQVGLCRGIDIGDNVMMSRYILLRVAEDLPIGVTFDPRPMPDWFGSGTCMTYSNDKTRTPGGMAEIERLIARLGKRHDKHMSLYGRNTGADKFTSGVGDRAVSVRIPTLVAQKGMGYLEDRRPASNCDPYVVAEALVRTCLLNE